MKSNTYEILKWTGAIFWNLSYIMFIITGIKLKYCPIPWILCSYNISFEIFFSIFAVHKGSRIRNRIWLIFDLSLLLLLYVYGNGIHGELVVNTRIKFLIFLTIFLIIHVFLSKLIHKEKMKLFAWIGTCLISIGLIINSLERGQPIDLNLYIACIFKSIGDFFYALAHIIFGFPVYDNKNYIYLNKFIYVFLVLSIILNIVMLYIFYSL